jgi:hypothetical protein
LPVPASIADLSTTVGNNSPGGGESPTDGDNYLRSHASFIAELRNRTDGTTAVDGVKLANVEEADADTLDWYEEATFTPSLTFGGGSTGLTYGVQSGRYTRVGNKVFFHLRITLSAVGSSTGVASISGLPYALGGSVPFDIPAPGVNGAAALAGPVSVRVVGSSLDLYHISVVATGARAALTHANFTAATDLTIHGFYEAA